MTYSSLYACGSPFDQSVDKPLICEAIDPIKLDLYALYQSHYYQTKIDPYVAPLVRKGMDYYHDYGVPAQIKLNEIYLKQVKPEVIRGTVRVIAGYEKHVHPVYVKKIAPVIQPYVDQAKPHIHHAKSYLDKVKEKQIKPLYYQATEKALEAQKLIQHKYENLPPHIKQVEIDVKNKVMSWVDQAENLEMAPILLDLYWSIVDFYQLHFLPMLHANPAVNQIKLFYNENAKTHFDEKVKPLIAQLNNKVHLDVLFQHIISFLPAERQIIPEEPVYTAKSAYIQPKTSTSVVVPKTQHVPITSPAASVKTVTISKGSSSSSSSSSTTTTDIAVPASTTIVSPTVISKKVDDPQATLAPSASNNNDDDIVSKVASSSVKPKATTTATHFVPDPNAAPDADKKEAIYCPTCNAEEEQMIVANTDKDIAPVRTDKHVIAVPTDHDVFEVHEEVLDLPSPPPSSPNHDFEDSDQVIIQAPIPPSSSSSSKKESPTTTSVKEEDIIYSIQTEVEPTTAIQTPISHQPSSSVDAEEEDIIYSIQTEVPTAATDEEEEPVFSIQTEPAAAIETDVESNLEREHVEEVDQRIVEEIRHEAKKEEFKKEDQIYVPPAIKNEELVLESRDEKAAANKDEPVFVKVEEPEVVEEPVHFEEPIVTVEEPVQCEEPIDVVPVAKSDDKIDEEDVKEKEEPVEASNKQQQQSSSFVVHAEELPKAKEPLAKQQIEVPVEQ